MNINLDITKRAMELINQRRTRAKTENELHFDEIRVRIPEISEINAQLANTGMEIIAVIRNGKNISGKIEELKKNNLQAQRMIKELLVKNGYPDDYLDLKYSCEKCGDTGFCGGKRCECLTKLISELAAERINSGSSLSLSSFETFDINMYKGKTPEETAQYRQTMSKLLDKCRNYAENFSKDSGNILMYGATGLGKTHLSLAIAGQVIKKGYTVLYDSAQNYLMQIEREHFGRAEDEDTLGTMLSADLLIMDDLGTEFDSQFYSSAIYNIINTRLSRGVPTIISTNLNYDGIKKKYDGRIASRFFTTYDIMKFVGTDIRLVKKMMTQGDTL